MRLSSLFTTAAAVVFLVMSGCSNQEELKKEAQKDLDEIGGDLIVEMPDAGDAKQVAESAGLDLAKLKEQFSGITSGFADLTAENASNLTKKLSDLSKSFESMGLDKLDASKLAMLKPVVAGFKKSLEEKVAAISDEGIMGKIKPAVTSLMDKLSELGL